MTSMVALAVTRYTTSSGVRLYRIPMQAFPTLVAHAYVVIAGAYAALIDAGSGLGASNAQLEAGFATLASEWGETLTWHDLQRIVITHAHVDHYGGLAVVRRFSDAPIAVHVLDRRVLVHHAERLALANRAVSDFLWRAGVTPEQHAQLLGMYGWSKGLFQSVDVATVLEEGDMLDGLFRVYHTPGHCPGQVCLQVDDVLLTADHILPSTSLFLPPESITPTTGLEHYLHALRRMRSVAGIRLALGGHETPIGDLYSCIDALEAHQLQRVKRIHAACAEPHTLLELTNLLYPGVSEYDRLLALQKVGAYVEYLDQRGELAVANFEDVAGDARVAPRYRQV